MKTLTTICALTLSAAALLSGPAAQAQPGTPPIASERETAPIDLEGYWIAVVTEDWMFRMVTPPKGQYLGVPLNREGRALADTWDAQRDAELGEQCKAYGAPALMRIPGRLRFSWEGDDVLRVETEAGEQTRRFYFSDPADARPDPLQGLSLARWERAPGGVNGKLVVETEGFEAGYLRRNGVPYSADARLAEYYSVYEAPQGDTWLVITTEVDDPRYLNTPFVTSTHFKKLTAEEGERWWHPEPCAVP